MTGGVLTLLCGVMALYARWNLPRVMQQARARAAAQGRAERIDARLASRLWHMNMALLTTVGVFGVVAGVLLLVTE